MISVEVTTDPQDFLARNEYLLLKEESLNNLKLGLADAAIKDPSSFTQPYFFTIYKNKEIVGQAVRSHSDRPLLVKGLYDESALALMREVERLRLNLVGVVGESQSADLFKENWMTKYQCELSLGMHQGIYELEKVTLPKMNNGSFVIANEASYTIINNFMLGFIKDCFPNDNQAKEKAKALTERHIKNKTLFLWKNKEGEAVSMAAKNRESRNAATISLVYTAESERGKGYGSIITALVSQRMLDEGKKMCNLYTDMANPVSNSIYQKIGYKKIGESKHYLFKERK
tara:strand:+ start:102260 stop:103120 length:861 start_codon:yes stop_codon:yes gene_type:complete